MIAKNVLCWRLIKFKSECTVALLLLMVCINNYNGDRTDLNYTDKLFLAKIFLNCVAAIGLWRPKKHETNFRRRTK